jgi:sugar lactone lactonase YvrE
VTSTLSLNGIGASLVIGQSNFTSSETVTTPSASRMFGPVGVALDPAGNLWVADQACRMLRFSPPFSNGMNADLVIGRSNFTSFCDGTQPPAANNFNMATSYDLNFDASGNLWVTDSEYNRVLRFSPPFSNGMNADLVIGAANFTSSETVTTPSASRMFGPVGVALDPAGNLWVADQACRMLRFSPPFSNGMNADLVIGRSNFTSFCDGTQPPAANNFNMATSYDLNFDASGNLWVTDSEYNRVLRFLTTQAVVDASTQTLSINIVAASGNSIKVILPGNSLPLGTRITISAKPSPPSAQSNAGEALHLLTPQAIDIETNNGSQPNQPLTIRMDFKNSELPAGASKSHLKICFFDTVSNAWVPLLPTSIDTSGNTATAQTTHLTTFGLLAFAPQAGVDKSVIYPIPWKPGSGDSRFNAPLLTFSNLPAGASIKIYKLTGELIKSTNADSSGAFLWNGTNNSGELVASGVYLALLEGGGSKSKKRIVIIR